MVQEFVCCTQRSRGITSAQSVQTQEHVPERLSPAKTLHAYHPPKVYILHCREEGEHDVGIRGFPAWRVD